MAFVPIYILILFFTIIIDYFAGIYIEKSHGKRRKLFLVASLVANIGVLAVFKYYNFFIENVNFVFHAFDIKISLPFLSILLPIGLSFHTFQAMSYTIEVYRGHQSAERNFGIYSLYVMFYPQLVAGPIERPQNLLHQFREEHTFDPVRVSSGLQLMVWGLFKKLVIADRLAIYVDYAYNNPSSQSGLTLLLATFFFAFQIYCDFSGYSDIAIGSARVMGIDLMKNFDRPYFSKSISEFWKRWHISLSTWFKDYLYISLGGNRVPVKRIYLNLLIVFVISGIWHGADWTYVIWGALNGFYLVFALIIKRYREKLATKFGLYSVPGLNTFLNVATTFSLVCFSWIFFRANSFSDSILIIRRIFTSGGSLYANPSMLIFSFFGIALLIFIETIQEYKIKIPILARPNFLVVNLKYALLVLLILLIGVFDGGQFIYFQF